MQATVSAYDEQTGGGTVVLDDGTPLTYAKDAVAQGGLRRLRYGQRVTVQQTDGTIAMLTIPGTPD